MISFFGLCSQGFGNCGEKQKLTHFITYLMRESWLVFLYWGSVIGYLALKNTVNKMGQCRSKVKKKKKKKKNK